MSTTTRLRATEKKRLHLVMRDGTALEATIVIADDMPLVAFLTSRKGGWMNAMDARDPKSGVVESHLVLQTDLIALASAPDANMSITATAGSASTTRQVEVKLLGGQTLQGTVALAAGQRLSDLLAQSGRFLGLATTTVLPANVALGDVAVNIGAIRSVADRRG
ncbi:MAG: hypothetical protein FJ361_00615 [Gemmatimonadetes bacterium]|nr:hypothetical protein [Gemmatimonadota bacterium]